MNQSIHADKAESESLADLAVSTSEVPTAASTSDAAIGNGAASPVAERLLTRYELINPSDPYTFKARSLGVAALVTMLLGQGKYSANPINDKDAESVPFFLFGGHEEWCREHGWQSVEALLDSTDSAELATAFESVTLGRNERSSMNNIGARARKFADHLRQATPKELA